MKRYTRYDVDSVEAAEAFERHLAYLRTLSPEAKRKYAKVIDASENERYWRHIETNITIEEERKYERETFSEEAED